MSTNDKAPEADDRAGERVDLDAAFEAEAAQRYGRMIGYPERMEVERPSVYPDLAAPDAGDASEAERTALLHAMCIHPEHDGEHPDDTDYCAFPAAPSIEAVERIVAARVSAAATKARSSLVSRLGFGDGITEPMADDDTIVAWIDERCREADEWRESQRWRDECALAGHPDDEDCHEHDPQFAATKARAEGAAEAGERIARAIIASVSYGFGMNHDGTEDGHAMAYVAGLGHAARIARSDAAPDAGGQ